MAQTFEFLITAEHSGKTVKTFLRQTKGFSTSFIKKLKQKDDGILLNGKKVFVDKIIFANDILKLTANEEPNEEIIPSNDSFLDIIYEDEDLLVVDKPPFLPVHPSKGHPSDSLANIVAAYYIKNGQTHKFRCVTRLDKNTSGVVVLAKNTPSHDKIRKQFLSGTVEKKYFALVHGKIELQGSINIGIIRPDEATIKRMASHDGAAALTDYSLIKYYENPSRSLLEIFPKTGRTHQIRVHMAFIGHPLCGDFLYGNENDGFLRQMLHATEISITHPRTGEKIIFKTKKKEWFYEQC